MRKFVAEDYPAIQEWCVLRSMHAPPLWSLPPNGLIIEDVAVGFLVITDNSCGLLEFYIANPLAQEGPRDLALDRITDNLIAMAKGYGLRVLMCSSKMNAVKLRAAKHGFDPLGEFATFSMEL